MLLGPRNSLAQNLNMLERASCSKLIYSDEMGPVVGRLGVEKLNLSMANVQPLDAILSGQARHFPFEKSFHEAERDPVLILHSSGSTGRSNRHNTCKLAKLHRLSEAYYHDKCHIGRHR